MVLCVYVMFSFLGVAICTQRSAWPSSCAGCADAQRGIALSSSALMKLRLSLMPLKRDPKWSKTLFFSWHGLMLGRGVGHNSGVPSLHAVNFFPGEVHEKNMFWSSAGRIFTQNWQNWGDWSTLWEERFQTFKIGSVDWLLLSHLVQFCRWAAAQQVTCTRLDYSILMCSCYFNVFLLLFNALISWDVVLRLVRVGPAKRWGPGAKGSHPEDASSCDDVACVSEDDGEIDGELMQYLQSNTSFLLAMSSTDGLSDTWPKLAMFLVN